MCILCSINRTRVRAAASSTVVRSGYERSAAPIILGSTHTRSKPQSHPSGNVPRGSARREPSARAPLRRGDQRAPVVCSARECGGSPICYRRVRSLPWPRIPVGRSRHRFGALPARPQRFPSVNRLWPRRRNRGWSHAAGNPGARPYSAPRSQNGRQTRRARSLQAGTPSAQVRAGARSGHAKCR